MCWIYIDTSVDECMIRIHKRGRKEECEITYDYIQALDRNHKKMIEKQNAFVVNGNLSEQEVFNETLDLLESIKCK